jgi:hypothetical protein
MGANAQQKFHSRTKHILLLGMVATIRGIHATGPIDTAYQETTLSMIGSVKVVDGRNHNSILRKNVLRDGVGRARFTRE